MKLQVIKSFIDKHSNIPYNAGYYYESNDLERIKELQELGYLKKIQINKEDTIETAVPDKPNKNGRKQQKV